MQQPQDAPLQASPAFDNRVPLPPVGSGIQAFAAGPSVVQEWPQLLASTAIMLERTKMFYDKWCQVTPLKKREKKIESKNAAAGHNIYDYGYEAYIKLIEKDYPQVEKDLREQVATAMAWVYFYNQVVDLVIEDKVTVDSKTNQKDVVNRVNKIGRSDNAPSESDTEMKSV